MGAIRSPTKRERKRAQGEHLERADCVLEAVDLGAIELVRGADGLLVRVEQRLQRAHAVFEVSDPLLVLVLELWQYGNGVQSYVVPSSSSLKKTYREFEHTSDVLVKSLDFLNLPLKLALEHRVGNTTGAGSAVSALVGIGGRVVSQVIGRTEGIGG